MCLVYGTLAVSDMIMFNRRKKKQWIEDKLATYFEKLTEAQAAEERGQATEEQLVLVEKEKAIKRIERAEQEKKGWWWKKPRNWLRDKFKKDEGVGGMAPTPSPVLSELEARARKSAGMTEEEVAKEDASELAAALPLPPSSALAVFSALPPSDPLAGGDSLRMDSAQGGTTTATVSSTTTASTSSSESSNHSSSSSSWDRLMGWLGGDINSGKNSGGGSSSSSSSSSNRPS